MVDRVAGIVEAVRLRIEEELQQQLRALTADQEQAMLEVRRSAEHEAQEAETRWSAMLDGVRTESRQEVEMAVGAARQAWESERETHRRAAGAAAEPVKQLIEELDRCQSLTEVLDRVASATAARPGGALFVTRDGTFEPWRDQGGAATGLPLGWEQLVDPAVRQRTVQRREGIKAVPLSIDGTVVAVVVSAETGDLDLTTELIAAASAARLTALTASRLVQAERWTRPAAPRAMTPPPAAAATASETPEGEANDTPALSARRYARLLISEIKLYNEAAVCEGRAHRDLGHRLDSEITRARQIYEARVPPDVPGRADHFQEELVRTLADGDASLLA